MVTEVQSKGYMPGYYSMKDLNEDSNSCSWPIFYEDNMLSNGHCNGFLPRALPDTYDKDILKQQILEHEAVFKNQVYELHRVYRTQRGLMEEFKRKELHDDSIPTESSFSSSPLRYQTTPEGFQKWKSPILHSPKATDGKSSISGTSATASPFSCVREKNAHTSPFPFHIEGSSRNYDGLETRPPKVRRKLLDLELPASEYVDNEYGEHAKAENVSGNSTYHTNRNCGNGDSGVTMCMNRVGKAESQLISSAIQRKNCLADLNEPLQMEGTNSAVVGSHSQVSCHKEMLHMEPKSQFVGLPKEAVLNSHHFNGMPNSLKLKTQKYDKGWISRVLQSGCSNDNVNSNLCRDEKNVGPQARERGHDTSCAVRMDSAMASQICTPYSGGLANMQHSCFQEAPSWEMQKGSLSQNMKTHMHPSFNSSFNSNSQPSQQSHNIFSNGWHTNRYNQYSGNGLFKDNGFCLGSSSESKKLAVNVSSPGYSNLSRSIDINATFEHLPNHGYAKSYNGFNVMNPKFEKDLNLNAVPPNSLSIDQLPGKTFEVIDLESKNDGILPWLRPKSIYNGMHVMNPKIEIDLNLNAAPQNTSYEQFSRKTAEVIDLESKNDGILPWLRPMSACNREVTDVGGDTTVGKMSFLHSPNQLLMKKESEIVSSSHYASDLTASSPFSKTEVKQAEIRDWPKILGVPIFEKPCSSKSKSNFFPPALSSTFSSECNVQENKKLKIAVDINLPCDPDPDIGKQIMCETQVAEKGKDANAFRHQIDLNSFANEDENCLVSHVSTTSEKVVVNIDLEAPYIPESEDDVTLEGPVTMLEATEQNTNSSLYELVKVAAEAIVSISSYDLENDLNNITLEASTQDPLGWFAEIVSSCGYTTINNLGTVSGGTSCDGHENTSEEEIDYFELMTLKLIECREEEYMPQPLVPVNINIEETGTSLLTNRPRRGQARRGRRRNNFQRDILPGLASLSRHEVTEDLHTFGGLMRATGHSWNSRLGGRTSGRKGSGRGRRRSLVSSPRTAATSAASTPSIQHVNNVEVGLGLDDRNFQGWGKTTRRPRRQRLPAGHLPTLPVT